MAFLIPRRFRCAIIDRIHETPLLKFEGTRTECMRELNLMFDVAESDGYHVSVIPQHESSPLVDRRISIREEDVDQIDGFVSPVA
jgi:hypothetical protein